MPNAPHVDQALRQVQGHVRQVVAAMEAWVGAYQANNLAEDAHTATAHQQFEAACGAIEQTVAPVAELFGQTHFRTMSAALRNLRHQLGVSDAVAKIAINTARKYDRLLGMLQITPADMNNRIHNGFPGF